jgi:hypothetical protein
MPAAEVIAADDMILPHAAGGAIGVAAAEEEVAPVNVN